MLVDVGITAELSAGGPPGGELAGVGAAAARAEAAGYDGVWAAETNHDPFLPLTMAAANTSRVDIGSGIAVAFARSPMTTAVTAFDLNRFAEGRFVLGLGSQIAAHITRRYSMPWSHPAARMREYVAAMRAIWETWQTGARLDFRGDFYTHTLMTPVFEPGANAHGGPRVFVAGVGPRMTEVAGEVADGFLVHGFTTERYLREVTAPALAVGRERAGSTMDGFDTCGTTFVVTGHEEDETAAAAADVRRQIAFYASTPAYRPVLELHGWGDLQTELHGLSKQGRWAEMGRLIDDSILETFAVVADPGEVAAAVLERFGGVVTRVNLAMPWADEELRSRTIATLRGG